MNINFNLLKELVSVYGPSSNEGAIREFIKNEIKDYVDEIETDNLGNLIARKKGNGKKIMISDNRYRRKRFLKVYKCRRNISLYLH